MVLTHKLQSYFSRGLCRILCLHWPEKITNKDLSWRATKNLGPGRWWEESEGGLVTSQEACQQHHKAWDGQGQRKRLVTSQEACQQHHKAWDQQGRRKRLVTSREACQQHHKAWDGQGQRKRLVTSGSLPAASQGLGWAGTEEEIGHLRKASSITRPGWAGTEERLVTSGSLPAVSQGWDGHRGRRPSGSLPAVSQAWDGQGQRSDWSPQEACQVSQGLGWAGTEEERTRQRHMCRNMEKCQDAVTVESHGEDRVECCGVVPLAQSGVLWSGATSPEWSVVEWCH